MNRQRDFLLLGAFACAVALLSLGGCRKEDSPRNDGESHFLETCASSCGDGLQCLCGVCTLPCESTQMCNALNPAATCGVSVGGICGAKAPTQGICHVSCKDSSACVSIGAGYACEAGSCVRHAGLDAGTLPQDSSMALDADELPQTPLSPNKLDVLFMIDNSGSMREEQEVLRAAMPTFVTGLQTRFGAALDLHVGFITSDVGAGDTFISGNPACNRPGGDRGELQVLPNCGLENGKFVRYSQQGSDKNFTGELSQVVGCLAQMGTQGCGFEHQLQSIRLALDPVLTPNNAGFVRADARLMLVMLTDEDDCSGAPDSTLFASEAYPGTSGSLRCSIEGHLCNGAKPPLTTFAAPLASCVANPSPSGLLTVTDLVASVRSRKPVGAIEVLVLGGVAMPGQAAPDYKFASVVQPTTPSLLDAQPVCAASNGTATPALRLGAFAAAFGGTLRSICESSFTDSMTVIAAGRR
ncbi:MAG: hypothetical protein SF187_22380 [Deltaproteobacteria bacterium]|nr:hypothetical protein [Deltaproteobacteria bacterium]